MRKKALLNKSILIVASFFFLPMTSLAADCLVDAGFKNGNGGEKEKKFKTISKALEKGCKKVVVTAGEYNGDITLDSSVSLEGKNRDKVLINGKVTMKNGASLSGLTVSGPGGVSVVEDASVKLNNLKIKGASVGIKTVVGKGKVTVNNVKIFSGKKGMYLQAGNNVKITNCDVSNNKEEGIDIRANVSGTISGNSIINNGESGIEVILGKADLVISGNSIKKNKSSGIASQYYSGMGKTGAVKIKNNAIAGNSHYGINCKTPSGGRPPEGFWEASMDMFSNKLTDNKLGNFAPKCSLSEMMQRGAVMTKEEREAAIKQAEEDKKREEEELKKVREEELIARERKENEAREETLWRLEQERQQKEQEQREKEAAIDELIESLKLIKESDQEDNAQLNKRSKFALFFIGANQQIIRQIEGRKDDFQSKIELLQQNIFEVESETKRSGSQDQLNDFKKSREAIEKNIQEKKLKRGIFNWLKREK
ncbi:MAG TPA: hypothetical protein GX706_03850 [Candidatus Moranbacteria bacterium]|nr:hypothetical protein [Candidatus Moranbacteria bacterium]